MKKENTSPSPLKKNIKDVTADDIAALEKPLGTSQRPFPMWGSQRIEHNGRADLEQVLSVIADDSNPLKIYSDREYKDVIALAYCDMPVPSMLPLFFDGLERRRLESTNRTQMMIGDPGHGKSFLGALQGRLRTKGPVEVYDCGGKNMNDLLFEMVLDFGAGEALPTAIDKRLKAGTLEPLSLALLKGLPGVVLTGDTVTGIDWTATKTAGSDSVEKAFEVLKKVSKIEGLDNAGGNALGMNSQYGALVRAFLDKREIVLDEYNKSRDGSDNALQTVWQFMIGEIKECTVENPLKNKDATSGPSTFTFKREDTGVGFFVTLTGNKTEDGVTTRSLNKSVYSRLSPQTLPDPDVIDWQHRICQMMVGLPVSTLYVAFKERADKDPDGFGDWLMWLRKTKAETEGTPIPALQETLLSNWKNVVESSEKLARFYEKWSQLADSQKIMANGNGSLVEEVDDEYSKKEGIDFRKIKQHLEEAIPIRPRMQQADAPVALEKGSWDKAPKLSEKIEENPALSFGTRLVEFLERMVYEKSGAVGKYKLYEALRKSMEEEGLRDITLQEGARNQRKSVEEYLNISSFADRDMNKQAAMARKVFCDYLRSVDAGLSANDEDIITVTKLKNALEAVNAAAVNDNREVFVVNSDIETLTRTPIDTAEIRDMAEYQLSGKTAVDFTIKDMVAHSDFVASLALPTVGRKNLDAVWDTNARKVLALLEDGDAPENAGDASPSAPGYDESMLISENRSALGLGLTTVQVRQDDNGASRPVSVHILRNGQRDKTLVVGEKVPTRLVAAFKEAGITYVNRNDASAKAKVDAAVSELTRGMPEETRTRLVQAFGYRNDIDGDETDGKQAERRQAQIAELLVDKSIDMLHMKALVKAPKRAA